MPTARPIALRLPALRVRQGRDRVLYQFAVDGKLLPGFAAVSRVGRGGDQRIVGYQRPEVRGHIAEIATYLESANPILPNAVVVAFDPTVRFAPAPGQDAAADVQTGTLTVPGTRPGGRKPGWVVDGQQRLAAVRDARVDRFPVCVIGFVAAEEREQREQFILVNNTKPLPKGLVYELLPVTDAQLPAALHKRRFPTALLDRLNLDADSPLAGLVRTPTRPGGVIKDNSLIKLLENSLTDGALYRLRGRGPGEADDVEAMLAVVKRFWAAVRDVFPAAWGLPPRRSRLLHGAGVVALGFVMDAIADRHRAAGVPTEEGFRADLLPLTPACRWTDGYWEFGPGAVRKWNEVQNTPKDIQVLGNYLVGQYRQRVSDVTTRARV